MLNLLTLAPKKEKQERQVKYMARFCANCGVQITEGKKFCAGCGQNIEEPQPAQRTQAVQQPYPPVQQQQYIQQPQYQQPYYAEPVKKKRKVPLPVKILLGFAAVVCVIIAVALLVTGNTAKQDFIKIGKDKIPSVKLILGEERKVAGVSSSVDKNGVAKKVIEYSVAKDQNSEMFKYAQALYDEYGFVNITDNDFTGPTGTDFEFAKESVEKDCVVIVRIDYDLDGYTVTLVQGEGTMTDNSTPEQNQPTGEDAGSTAAPLSTNTPVTAAPFSTNTPATDQPVTTDTGSNSGGADRVTGDILKLFGGGTYHMEMIERDSGIDMVIYAKGGMTAISFETEDMYYHIVNRDDKSYVIMYELETIFVSEFTDDISVPSANEIDSLTYVAGGSDEFMGRTYRFDEYSAPLGVRTQYFMDGATLKGIRTISTDGSISEMEIIALDNDVPADIFDIPDLPMYDLYGEPIE